jgi:hypothetical protein
MQPKGLALRDSYGLPLYIINVYRGEIVMHGYWWRLFISLPNSRLRMQTVFVIGILLFCVGGCSWYRTEQGWLISRKCWSLEFRRMQGDLCTATECSEGSSVGNPNKANCASTNDGEDEVLNRVDPAVLEKYNNSPFARMMERRGRLGVCASCGHLGRFKEAGGKEQIPQPVIARLHPVPTQPAFCPREEVMHPASYRPGEKEQGPAAPSKLGQQKEPLPEEILAPPEPTDAKKSASAAPRRLDAPQEMSSWIFASPPDVKPDPVVEPYIPPRDTDRTARR